MTIGSAASIWRRVCCVGGVTTELLGVNATSGRPDLQVVVFPGNPGSAAYFKPFMLSVHQELAGRTDVLAVTHAGHDPESDQGGRLWDLSQQIDHKVSFLREHVLLPGRPPVVLVGHSIGATMMVKAVAQIEGLSANTPGGGAGGKGATGGTNPLADPQSSPFTGAAAASEFGSESESGSGSGSRFRYTSGFESEALPPIVKLVAVFPFFETNFAGNYRQRRLRMIAPWYELLGWVGAAVTSLPLALQLAFVRLNAAMDSDAVLLTVRLLRRHTVRNAFFLASHEFKELSKPWDWSLLQLFGTRLHVMVCDHDTWMSRRQYEDMLARVPGLQATWHSQLRHAFCTSAHQSAEVARAVATITQSFPAGAARNQASQGSGKETRLWGSLAASISAISVSRAGSDSASSLSDPLPDPSSHSADSGAERSGGGAGGELRGRSPGLSPRAPYHGNEPYSDQ